MSRRRPDGILSTVRSLRSFNALPHKLVAITLCITVVAWPWPRSARALERSATTEARTDGAKRDTLPVPVGNHFLRDAVPTAGFAAQPEDSTEEDEEFLPEEKDTKKLVWEIAAWVIGAALVAFFIIKVFIEEEPDESDNGGGTKPDPF